MTPPIKDPVLSEQRQALRRQLTLQRELIARQIDPAVESADEYPRSMTMRLLTRHGPTAARLLSLWAGGRLLRSTSALAVLARMVQSRFRDR
jgi:hypothetical protein